MTASEQRTYEFIRDYIAEHGWAPSMREIAKGCGMSSVSGVHYRLQSLAAQGLIRHRERSPRTIQILEVAS